MKFVTPATAILIWMCLLPGVTRACQYNVRDVGFVDLEAEDYRFYAFVRTNTPADSVSLLRALPPAALRDCNVQVEVVNLDGPTNHPAFKFLPGGIGDSFPTAVLVSPDGQALPVSLSQPGRTFRDSLTAVLGEIASSPKREEILRAVSQAFGAVLLIEGDNADANKRARQTITNALEAIRSQMHGMPKTITEPPAMIVIEAATLARERVLLWSLGLDTTRTGSPRAAVLYGRARWIGPLMQGDEIAEPNLTGILSIIGADCECGLDVGWTQGTRLPVRWDEAMHAQVTKTLGFDPENPLVKLEVSRIVERSAPSRFAPAGRQAAALDSESGSTRGKTPATGNSSRVAQGAPRGRPAAEKAALVGSAAVLSRALVFLAGLAAIVVSAGLLIVWRTTRNRRNPP